jgi:hypothetical protein
MTCTALWLKCTTVTSRPCARHLRSGSSTVSADITRCAVASSPRAASAASTFMSLTCARPSPPSDVNDFHR